MDLGILLECEVQGDEAQEARVAIQASGDLALLVELALGAVEHRWRLAAAERLADDEFKERPAFRLLLWKIVKQSEDEDVRRMLTEAIKERKRSVDSPDDWGKTILNPQLPRYLHKHRRELDLSDEHDLDLMQYVAWQRDDGSSVTRRIAQVMYDMLPQSRRDEVDGKVARCGWDPSCDKYFLVRRLVEREDDAARLEEVALSCANNWIRGFALARLTGWCTYQEEDYWSFATYQCQRLEGYPTERLVSFLRKLVAQGTLDAEEAADLLAKAE